MTGRLPFDPARTRLSTKHGERAGPGGQQPPGLVVRTGGDDPISVTQLAARIDSAVKTGIPGRIRVVGEISSVSQRTHWYFSLKDEGAVISSVLFASSAKRVRVTPTQGDRVILTGRLDYYAPSGRLSLIVDGIEAVGQGALERELRERVELARSRGWLDPARKRRLPTIVQTVAVITSRDGAAVQDVIETTRQRFPAARLLIVDVLVQGPRAAPQIAHAVRTISARSQERAIDAVLLTRGGGSLEDLWAFNEMEVAEAIVGSAVPTVAAVGHETDVTLAELVADVRASTPTQAAMQLFPDWHAIDEQCAWAARAMRGRIDRVIADLRARLDRLSGVAALRDPRRPIEIHLERLNAQDRARRSAIASAMMRAERRLHRAGSALERHRPSTVHARREARIDELAGRLARGLRAGLDRHHSDLDGLHRELHAVGPMQVLARGYSVTMGSDGRAIRSAGDADPGETIRTRLADGSIRSRVVADDDARPGATDAGASAGDGKPRSPNATSALSARPPRRRGRGKDNRDQLDLF